MKRIHTTLTDLLGVDSPVVVPPMTFASGAKLAAEVSRAGGFGFMASGMLDGPAFARELGVARDVLGLPADGDAALPIGAGYFGWMLDAESRSVETLRVGLAHRVRAVWLSFGDDLGRWVRFVRRYDAEERDPARPHRTLVWVLVNSVAEAQRAATEWGVDVLVVQGIEAGGHGHGEAPPLLTLLPLVQDALPTPGPALVAAGGITTGAQVAALLVLGAAGCVLGTRFLATPEATYTAGQKAALLAAPRTVRTEVFDEMRASVKWPPGVDGRAVPNVTLDEAAEGVPLEERRRRYADAVKADDTSRAVVWAGASVALVKEITPAGDLTRAIHDETVAHLERVTTLVVI